MTELKEYDVEINGNRTTMRLTEEDAKRYGAVEVDQDPAETTTKAQTSTPNKAATPANKSGGKA